MFVYVHVHTRVHLCKRHVIASPVQNDWYCWRVQTIVPVKRWDAQLVCSYSYCQAPHHTQEAHPRPWERLGGVGTSQYILSRPSDGASVVLKVNIFLLPPAAPPPPDFAPMNVVKCLQQCWWGCEENETLVDCEWKCKTMQSQWQFLKKMKLESQQNPAISLLGIFTQNIEISIHFTIEELKPGTQRYICIPLFTKAIGGSNTT